LSEYLLRQQLTSVQNITMLDTSPRMTPGCEMLTSYAGAAGILRE
jgi:hypothetical protein